MARTELGLVFLLPAVLSGCSLIVKEVSLPACTGNPECEVLNTVQGDKPITRCNRYQCSGNAGNPGVCVYRPLDADNDGHVSATCPNGDDCDDANPVIYEGHAELCDGLDNDCDLVIDDGDFSGTAPSVAFDTTNAVGLTWGTSGSGTYSNATKTTFAFALDGEGVLRPAAAVLPQINGDDAFGNLASTSTPIVQAGCGSRAASWVARPSCASDGECPAPRCTWGTLPDGGGPNYDAGSPLDGGWLPAGHCEAVEGAYETLCTGTADCAWVCASERCVPPGRAETGNDVQVDHLCEFAELATSPIGSDGAFAVGIETDGCSVGRLRVGWLDTAQHLQMFGPEARSNVWLGVDVGAFARDGGDAGSLLACSGAERGLPGATRPAVAALGPADHPQALAVYLSDARTRSRCGDAVSIPVEGLGLWRETGRGMVSAWVTGTHDGHPEMFGETNGGGAPAVAAVGELGWVVGYPEATVSPGTPLALHYVGRRTPPAPFTSRAPDGGNAPAHVRRPTVSLEPDAPFIELPAGGRADYVTLAVGALRGTLYDLGVAWMEGCENDGAETVWFSLVRFDPASPGTATATAPVQLSTPVAPGGFPAIVYAGTTHPFVTLGWGRTAGEAAPADALGGFVVAWAGSGRTAEGTGVYAVRVMEFDGLPLDPTPLTLTQTISVTNAASVTTYAPPGTADGHISYSYWDDATQVMGAPLICPPI